jgi:anti-sigma B factor antagonist
MTGFGIPWRKDMLTSQVKTAVRPAGAHCRVIEIHGEVNLQSEERLMQAFDEASRDGASWIVLNFAGMDYMNSGGIGVVVTMVIRARRAGKGVAACCLSPHYLEIFNLTRLDEVVRIYPTEA